jgi:hypothetical protein
LKIIEIYEKNVILGRQNGWFFGSGTLHLQGLFWTKSVKTAKSGKK